ncbi:hypothetical protein HOY80DRAFT_1135937 [Tuber brumale]|nr:hypothetical protein HOY80DRAFT_1135937 [Tuber brumale]
MCTPTGSTERQVVPRSHRKPEFGDAGKSGWGDLQALGAKSRTRRNIKIGDGNKRLKSKLIAIKNPHSDGVRATVKDKATAFLRLGRRRRRRRRRSQVFGGIWRLGRGMQKWLASTRRMKGGCRKTQWRTMRLQEMHEEMVLMHREKKGRKQREMQMRKKE